MKRKEKKRSDKDLDLAIEILQVVQAEIKDQGAIINDETVIYMTYDSNNFLV